MSVELLDFAAEDDESVVIAHLRDMLPDGQVANSRMPNDPLPAVLVQHVSGIESVEESYLDAVVATYCLHPRGLGNSGRQAAMAFSQDVHRRMLLLARELPPVAIGDRVVDVQFCSVFSPPGWHRWADEKILCRFGRYQLGLDYARMP